MVLVMRVAREMDKTNWRPDVLGAAMSAAFRTHTSGTCD
jgi:hypothetical protein